MAGDAEDRTHAATPKRRQRAREQGQAPLSREVSAAAALAVAAAALLWLTPPAAARAARRLSLFLSEAHRWDLADGGRAALATAAADGAWLAAPFALGCLVVGSAAVLLQTGALVNLAALRVDLGRISPTRGVRRLLGADNAVELGKSLLKLAAMGVAAWMVLRDALPQLAALPFVGLGGLPATLLHVVVRVLLLLLAVQAAIAAADLAWVRLRHARGLRMSGAELREEARESDGDPHVKGRIKQIRTQRARKRMLKAVPKATVVVTNPTHYAVALAYDRAAGAAPTVVAKGVDTIAARIREVAAAHGVPTVANPPLARALHRVPLDTEIPAEHYQAVAELIAYVWRLSQRVAARPQA